MENNMMSVMAPEKTDIKSQCLKHMHRYVGVWVKDGTMYDGIVEHVDDEKLYLAVPIGGGSEMENVNLPYPPKSCGCGSRAFVPFFPYVPFPAFGYPFPHGRRRFNRLILPLAALTAISLLPYY